jgi:hypothetical protein
MTHGGSEDDFSELVAATGDTLADGDWRATAENPFDVSSVECDARLARWSRRTGGLAIRFTQSDNVSWWMAVHHQGQRLFAMVHHFGPESPLIQLTPQLGDMELGRDPLRDILKEPGLDADEIKRLVADHRAEQWVAAMAQGRVMADKSEVVRALTKPTAGESGIADLLAHLGAATFTGLCIEHPMSDAEAEMPFSVQRIIGKALVTGCLLPTAAGAVTFVVLLRLVAKAGMPAIVALLAAMVGSWLVMNGLRHVSRRTPTKERWRDRLTLAWASTRDAADGGPIRPTAAALNTWGGFFYLLRDIAFFSGIDRPQGAFALYIEAWAVGPPLLVTYMNRVAAGGSDAEPLFDAAKALVNLRNRLIEDHLQQKQINPSKIATEVQDILQPMGGQVRTA